MADAILSLSERGQITIPQKIREQIAVSHFICKIQGGKILLEPLQTSDSFLTELDNAEKDWKKHGGSTLDEIKIKHKPSF